MRLRGEGVVGGAVHHALAGYIINRGSEPVVRGNVVKLGSGRGFGGLNIAYANLHCGSRHGEGVNRVALLNGGNGLAGAVGNGQLIQLVALVRGQGNGNGSALFRVGRRSVYAAVIDRRGGYLVGRLAGGGAAGGTGGRLGVGEGLRCILGNVLVRAVKLNGNSNAGVVLYLNRLGGVEGQVKFIVLYNGDFVAVLRCVCSILQRLVRIAVYLSNNIRVSQCKSERAETVGSKRNLAGSCIGSCNIQVSTIIVVDINLFALESIRQSYLNLSRTNLCILCRFQRNRFLISTSLCNCNQVILRSNVHRNRIARGIICSYGNIQVGFLYNGNGSILRNRAVLIQCNLFVLYKFSQSLRLVVCRNRSGVRQLGRSYACADSRCSSFIVCSDFIAQSCLSSALLGISLDFVFVLNFNGANLVLVAVLITCYAGLAGYAVSGRVNVEVAAGNINLRNFQIRRERRCKQSLNIGNIKITVFNIQNGLIFRLLFSSILFIVPLIYHFARDFACGININRCTTRITTARPKCYIQTRLAVISQNIGIALNI